MQCCGDPFDVGSTVSWNGSLVHPDAGGLLSGLDDDLGRTVDYVEDHHAENDGDQTPSGCVRKITAVWCSYRPVATGSSSYEFIPSSVITAERSRADGWEHEDLPTQGFLGYLVDIEP